MKQYTARLREKGKNQNAVYHAKVVSFTALLDLANEYQKDLMIDPKFENPATYIRYFSRNGMIMAMQVFGPFGK